MNPFKKALLGIDLGSRTIKGIQLKKTRDGKVSVSGHFFQDLARCNREDALRAAIETESFRSSRTASAVRDSEVLAFNLELPPMSDKELKQIVPIEVAEQGMLKIDEHTVDYVTSPQGVKAYCVKRSVVLEQMKILEGVGLKPATIESEMMAITAMLEFNDYLDQNESIVVFDLGENHLNSGLIVEGQLSLTRSNKSGFGQANLKLMNLCQIDFIQAEAIKTQYDFLKGPTDQKPEVAAVLEDVFTEIFKIIKKDLEFYQECSESKMRVDRVLLVGGGSQIQSATKVIEKFFSIPASVVNPFRNINIFTAHDSVETIAPLAPHMGTVVGLALASFAKGKAA